jgi:serine/threonine protein kinase
MHQSHTLPIGTLLKSGDYRIDSLLGQGGFGITYKATQTSLGRSVVIKEFYMDGRCFRTAEGNSVGIQSLGQGDFETFKDRFFEEAKLLAQFGSLPGIVNVIDFFREHNTVYYAMDFIEGETLHQHLSHLPNEQMNPVEAAELVRKVAVALAPVHARNVLHRDIKPANIIRQPNGDPVVLDFGAARAFISDKTAVHSVILTPGYAPPEQYASSGKYGPSIDIYALGAVLYRLITGTTPPASPIRYEEEMEAPHQLNAAVPQKLSEVVMKAMSLRSADRYANMSEFAAALQEAAQTRPEPKPIPSPPPLQEEKTIIAPAQPTLAATTTVQFPPIQHPSFFSRNLASIVRIGLFVLFAMWFTLGLGISNRWSIFFLQDCDYNTCWLHISTLFRLYYICTALSTIFFMFFVAKQIRILKSSTTNQITSLNVQNLKSKILKLLSFLIIGVLGIIIFIYCDGGPNVIEDISSVLGFFPDSLPYYSKFFGSVDFLSIIYATAFGINVFTFKIIKSKG